jgi:hypothetical protein
MHDWNVSARIKGHQALTRVLVSIEKDVDPQISEVLFHDPKSFYVSCRISLLCSRLISVASCVL